jgi:hypothetical protein
MTAADEVLAVGAFRLELDAGACMVANACAWPHVVHGPHHWLARLKDALDIAKRQHALIYPVEVNDVSLLKLRNLGDVCAGIGYVDTEKVLLVAKSVGSPDAEALPQESPQLHPLESSKGNNRELVRLFVTDQHLCLYSFALERFHQTVAGHCSAAYALRCIY